MRLDYLYFIVIFAGSQLWQAVQAMAVRLDYLYCIIIIWRESAVAGCTDHGCEAGLSVLHCDISRKSAMAGCTGHGCEAGLSVLSTSL